MPDIAIIHFSPLEQYPPVQNLLRVLEQSEPAKKIVVFTTSGTYNELKHFTTSHKNISIIRLGKSGQHINPFTRIWNYGLFYTGCLFYLMLKKPRRILYYETISSFPAILYRRYINKKAEVFIHYHEYTSAAEYDKGMKLTRRFHHFEKWLYPLAQWISHTNEYRMKLFEKDILPVKIDCKQIVPNYPPAAWRKTPTGINKLPVKIIYVGSLSLDTMYTREFAEWVIRQDGKVDWHIYSYNITKEARSFFEQVKSPCIIVKDGINYDDLPGIITQYDVGVILYKGHIPNYVYNAPNKLFEYLTCGLDTWYPHVMKGIYPYKTVNSFPKVVEVDFANLDHFHLDEAISREGLIPIHPWYCSEDAFAKLASAICNGGPGLHSDIKFD